MIRARAEDTEGKYALLDVIAAPNSGPPLHVHSKEDEAFYIIEGEVLIYYGTEKIKARAGYHIYMKRGIPHTFRNISNKECRLLVILTPAGFEACFAEIGVAVDNIESFNPPLEAPNVNDIAEILSKYGVKIV